MGYIARQAETEQKRSIEDYITWTIAWASSIIGTTLHFLWVNDIELVPLLFVSIPMAIALFLIGGIVGLFVAFGYRIVKERFEQIKYKKKKKEQDFQDWIKGCRCD